MITSLLAGWGMFAAIALPAVVIGTGIAVLFFMLMKRLELHPAVVMLLWMPVGGILVAPILIGGLIAAIHYGSLAAGGRSIIELAP